jgi:hypothetical protein
MRVLFVPGFPATHLHERDPAAPDQRGARIFINLALLNPIETARTREILDLLEGPLDLANPPPDQDPVIAGDPIAVGLSVLGFDLAKRAKSLYDDVRGLGVEIEGFGWDWRRPVWDAHLLDRLAARITALADDPANPSGKVTLIAHSTGGLIVRRLLEHRHARATPADRALLAKIAKVIAFGVPWAGTLTPLPFLLGEKGFTLISAEISQRIIGRAWAAFDLLPPPHDPAQHTDLVDDDGPLGFAMRGASQVGLCREPKWFGQSPGGIDAALRAAMAHRAPSAVTELGRRSRAWELPVELVNVAGWGEPTLVACDLQPLAADATRERLRLVDESSRDGDGTVPRRSAAWVRPGAGPGAAPVRSYHVPVGVYDSVAQRQHTSLWRTPGGRELLARELTGAAPERRLYAAADAEEANDGNAARVTVHLHACAADETPLPGVTVRAFGANQSVDIPSTTISLGAGRFAVQVRRAHMIEVPAGGNPQFRRFTLGVRWTGGAAEERFPFLVAR